MERLIGFLGSFWGLVEKFGKWILDSLVSAGNWLIYSIIDIFLSFVEGLVSLVDFPSVVFTQAAVWGGLDPGIVYALNAIGLPQFLAIISSAYLVRLTLNLIPAAFTRV